MEDLPMDIWASSLACLIVFLILTIYSKVFSLIRVCFMGASVRLLAILCFQWVLGAWVEFWTIFLCIWLGPFVLSSVIFSLSTFFWCSNHYLHSRWCWNWLKYYSATDKRIFYHFLGHNCNGRAWHKRCTFWSTIRTDLIYAQWSFQKGLTFISIIQLLQLYWHFNPLAD